MPTAITDTIRSIPQLFAFSQCIPLATQTIVKPIMLRRRKIVTRGRKALVVGELTEIITNIPTNTAKQIIFQCLFKCGRPYRSISAISRPDKLNLGMGACFSGRRRGMRHSYLGRLRGKKTGACRVVLSVYYTTGCASVNTYAETWRLSVIDEGPLGIPCKLAYHVLLGGIHIETDRIVLELLIFQVERHTTLIIGLLLGSVFLGQESARGSTDSLSCIR